MSSLSNSPPLVSVLIAYYDQPDYLLEAVNSVLNQTYPNIEVIVVDDCSAHPAEPLLGSIGNARLVVQRHEQNLGLGAARNSAFVKSSGELLLPLDGDDFIADNYIENTIESLAEHETFGGAYTQVQVFGDVNLIWIPDCTLLNIMCARPGPSTFVIKREVYESIGGYKTHLKHPDSDFWIRMLRKGWQFTRVESPLYHYRKYAGSMSHQHRMEEVSSLAREHQDLYVENIEAILQIEEEKFWELKDEYRQLEEGFKSTMLNYRLMENENKRLAGDYNAIVAHPLVGPPVRLARRILKLWHPKAVDE